MPSTVPPGEQVADRTGIDGTSAEGFRVRSESGGRYLVERRSDGVELPEELDVSELRAVTPPGRPPPR